MRGNASEVIQARRQRRFNEAQTKICLWIFPINLIAIIFCVFCAHSVFSADKTLALESSKSLFYAGTFLQSYWCYIVMRDSFLTLSNFIRGHRQAFAATLALHYLMACLDNLLLTGLMIWGTIAVNSTEASDFSNSPETTGLSRFLVVTTLNVVMAYIYVCSHVCAFPISLCIIARNPERFGFRSAD